MKYLILSTCSHWTNRFIVSAEFYFEKNHLATNSEDSINNAKIFDLKTARMLLLLNNKFIRGFDYKIIPYGENHVKK
jgi:hypothetical protein